MRAAALLLVAVRCCAGAVEFGEWARVHARSYATAAEREAAREAYAANVGRAALLTSGEAASGVHDASRSPYADLTPSEFAATRLLPPVRLAAGQLAESCLQNGALDATRLLALSSLSLGTEALPAAWDWRDHGAVSAVRDQGACGSCWAFSTAENIEGVWALATGEPVLQLSPQELVDCSDGCAPEGIYGTVCNSGCRGGWPWSAYEDIKALGGLQDEASYPYTGVARDSCAVQAEQPGAAARISGYTCLGSDESVLQHWLLAHGPISVALDASRLSLYVGGVFAPRECSQTSLDHAVLVVGYGSNATTGEDFWVVKNSWGETWGEEGFFRIARGSNACGIANAASSAVIFVDDGQAMQPPAYLRFVQGAATA
jgi:cathepsin F